MRQAANLPAVLFAFELDGPLPVAENLNSYELASLRAKWPRFALSFQGNPGDCVGPHPGFHRGSPRGPHLARRPCNAKCIMCNYAI